jgi:hypothetical protein
VRWKVTLRPCIEYVSFSVARALFNVYQDYRIRDISNAEGLSGSSKSSQCKHTKERSSSTETAAPVQPFEPVFAHLLDDVAKKTPSDPEVAKPTIRYMRAATGIYEDDRKKA